MNSNKAIGVAMALGVAGGSVIGVLTKNIALWISLGIAIGAGIGAVLAQKQKQDDDDKNNKEV